MAVPGYVTVFHNGVITQNHTQILGATRHRALPKLVVHDPMGPIRFQDHRNPTRYRNIWIRPLGEVSRLRKGKLKDHNSARRSVAWLAGIGFVVGMLSPAAQSAGRNDQPVTQNLPPPVHLTAEQDRQRTMELLHIDVLRSGPQSNPGLPNPANYDESKVDPSVKVPDPLILNNGKKVTTAKMWWDQPGHRSSVFRRRGLWPSSPADARELWEVEHQRNEWRSPSHYEKAGGSCGQLVLPAHSRQYSSHCKHSSQCQRAGPGDHGIRRERRGLGGDDTALWNSSRRSPP